MRIWKYFYCKYAIQVLYLFIIIIIIIIITIVIIIISGYENTENVFYSL